MFKREEEAEEEDGFGEWEHERLASATLVG